MAIYWTAIDVGAKKQIDPPKDFSIKAPGIYSPYNPFPNMVIMMNSRGYNFEMYNDSGTDDTYFGDYEDITDAVYKELLELFPWAKDYYEGEGE